MTKITKLLVLLAFAPTSLVFAKDSLLLPVPDSVSHLVEKTSTALLLKDPFGGHYEYITENFLPQPDQGDSVTIPNFKKANQGTAPWCWAACASMLLYNKGIKQSPCEIVSLSLGRTCCSLKSKILGDWECWEGGSVASALSSYGIKSTSKTGSIPEMAREVLKQLHAGKPAALVVTNKNFYNRPGTYKNHTVIAYGANNLNNSPSEPLELVLYDPVCGVVTASLSQLENYKNDWEKGAPSYRWSNLIHMN